MACPKYQTTTVAATENRVCVAVGANRSADVHQGPFGVRAQHPLSQTGRRCCPATCQWPRGRRVAPPRWARLDRSCAQPAGSEGLCGGKATDGRAPPRRAFLTLTDHGGASWTDGAHAVAATATRIGGVVSVRHAKARGSRTCRGCCVSCGALMTRGCSACALRFPGRKYPAGVTFVLWTNSPCQRPFTALRPGHGLWSCRCVTCALPQEGEPRLPCGGCWEPASWEESRRSRRISRGFPVTRRTREPPLREQSCRSPSSGPGTFRPTTRAARPCRCPARPAGPASRCSCFVTAPRCGRCFTRRALDASAPCTSRCRHDDEDRALRSRVSRSDQPRHA